jgi:DNA-binding MarR family transcriptional regulator
MAAKKETKNELKATEIKMMRQMNGDRGVHVSRRLSQRSVSNTGMNALQKLVEKGLASTEKTDYGTMYSLTESGKEIIKGIIQKENEAREAAWSAQQQAKQELLDKRDAIYDVWDAWRNTLDLPEGFSIDIEVNNYLQVSFGIKKGDYGSNYFNLIVNRNGENVTMAVIGRTFSSDEFVDAFNQHFELTRTLIQSIKDELSFQKEGVNNG